MLDVFGAVLLIGADLTMDDMLVQLDKLRAEARTSVEISRLTTDPQKRAWVAKLAHEPNVLVEAIERDLASGTPKR